MSNMLSFWVTRDREGLALWRNEPDFDEEQQLYISTAETDAILLHDDDVPDVDNLSCVKFEIDPANIRRIRICAECFEEVRATGEALQLCRCGSREFYESHSEADEIIEAMLDPEIFPTSCENCKNQFDCLDVCRSRCRVDADNYWNWLPKEDD